jgi:tRNA(Ile)-lysidine synthase
LSRKLLNEFIERVQEHLPVERGSDTPPDLGGDLVLIACSGGSDSTALAALAAATVAETALSYELIHFDHGLRRGSSDEGPLVKTLARELGFYCHLERLPLSERLSTEGGNLEGTAREMRYRALARRCRETGAVAVFTGHSADDRAETLWLWLLRGAGPRGLAPLPAGRPLGYGCLARVVRPLITCRRQELRQYLTGRGIGWLEDPTNNDLSLRRNFVRHRLLPMIEEEFGVDPVPAATRLAGQIGELDRFMEGELAASGLPAGEDVLSRAALAGVHPALAAWRLSAELSRLDSVSADAVEKILSLNRGLATGKKLDLPGGGEARFTHDELRLMTPGGEIIPPPDIPVIPDPPLDMLLPDTGEIPLTRDWTLKISLKSGPGEIPSTPWQAVFDHGSLALPLRMITSRPGLRLTPLGGPGSRKLSDLFIDKKVPREFRAGYPLLSDANGRIIWVPGLTRGDIAPVEDATDPCLCLDLERTSS